MPSISTFPAALNALLTEPVQDGRARHVQVIGVALLDAGEAKEPQLHLLVVDGEGRIRVMAAHAVKVTDDSVLPPKYA